jgi:hypothetical protein
VITVSRMTPGVRPGDNFRDYLMERSGKGLSVVPMCFPSREAAVDFLLSHGIELDETMEFRWESEYIIHPCANDGTDLVQVEYGDPATVLYGLYEVLEDGKLAHDKDYDRDEMDEYLQFLDGLRVRVGVNKVRAGMGLFQFMFSDLSVTEVSPIIEFYLSTIRMAEVEK